MVWCCVVIVGGVAMCGVMLSDVMFSGGLFVCV